MVGAKDKLMIVEREQDLGGVIFKAETEQENELLKYLWCTHAKMAEFTNLNGFTTLTLCGPNLSIPVFPVINGL
jgi:hypothetical protein